MSFKEDILEMCSLVDAWKQADERLADEEQRREKLPIEGFDRYHAEKRILEHLEYRDGISDHIRDSFAVSLREDLVAAGVPVDELCALDRVITFTNNDGDDDKLVNWPLLKGDLLRIALEWGDVETPAPPALTREEAANERIDDTILGILHDAIEPLFQHGIANNSQCDCGERAVAKSLSRLKERGWVAHPPGHVRRGYVITQDGREAYKNQCG